MDASRASDPTLAPKAGRLERHTQIWDLGTSLWPEEEVESSQGGGTIQQSSFLLDKKTIRLKSPVHRSFKVVKGIQRTAMYGKAREKILGHQKRFCSLEWCFRVLVKKDTRLL